MAQYNLQPWGSNKPQKESGGFWTEAGKTVLLAPPDLLVGAARGAFEIGMTTRSMFTANEINSKNDPLLYTIDKILNEDWKPSNPVRALVQGVGQFLPPAKLGATIALKGAKALGLAAGKTTRYGSWAVGGAFADAAAFRADDPNFANLIGENNELLAPIREMLAVNPDDPDIVNRARRAIEGVGLGFAVDAILAGLRNRGRRLFYSTGIKQADPSITLSPSEKKAWDDSFKTVGFDTVKQPLIKEARENLGRYLYGMKDRIIQGGFDFAHGARLFDNWTKGKLNIASSVYTSFRNSSTIANTLAAFYKHGGGVPEYWGLRKKGKYWIVKNATTKEEFKYSTYDQAYYNRERLNSTAPIAYKAGIKGMQEILETIAFSGQSEKISMYLIAKRMKYLKEVEGKVVPWTDEQIKLHIDNGLASNFVGREGKTVTYEAIEDDLIKFNRQLLAFAHSSGLIDRATMHKLMDRGTYIPFYRIFEEEKSYIPGRTNMRGGSKGKLKYRMEGSKDYVIDDPIRGLLENMKSIIEESVKNRTRRALYDTVDQMKKLGYDEVDEWASRENVNPVPQNINKHAMLEALSKKGIDIDPNVIDGDYFLVWARNYNKIGNDIDIVFRDGKAHYYRVKDPFLQKSVSELGPRAALKMFPLAIKLGGLVKATLTTLTTLSPDFLAKNTVRDAPTAWIFHRQYAAWPFVETFRGINAMRKHDKDYIEWQLNGGGNLGLQFIESGAMNRKVKRMIANRGMQPGQFLSLGKLLDWWTEMAGTLETANRYQEYRRLRITDPQKYGVKPLSQTEAALASREITSDFGLHGSDPFLRVLTATVPFLNAGLQGLYRAARGVTNPAERANVIKRSLFGIIGPTMALWYFNRNLPEYQNLPEEIKDTNWVIPLRLLDDAMKRGLDPKALAAAQESSYGVLLIPKPFEVGAVASIVERGFDMISRNNYAGAVAAAESIISDMFRLNITPQLIKPFYDVRNNVNWLGNPIIPDNLKNREPWAQTTPYTSDIANIAGRNFNVSPIQLQYLFEGYLGSIGAMVLDVADYMARPANKGVAPSPRWDDLPLIKSFFRDDPYQYSQDKHDFYKIWNKVRQVQTTYAASKNDDFLKTTDTAIKYLQNPENAVVAKSIFSFMEDIRRQVSDIDSNIGRIMNDARSNLTGFQKRSQIDRLNKKKNLILGQAMQTIRTNPIFKPLLHYPYKGSDMLGIDMGFRIGEMMN